MSSSSLVAVAATADDEVVSAPSNRPGRSRRHTFTPAQKLKYLSEYEVACETRQGNAYLRGEGLYSSLMSEWRRQRDAGLLEGKRPGEPIGRPSAAQAVLIDIFPRSVVGAIVHACEDGILAKEMMLDAFGLHGTLQVVHSDGGPSMTSKTVTTLLADLGITKSRSRPHVSNDNPFSEALFTTVKYLPVFPDRFSSLGHAREFLGEFVDAYNHHHRHTGIGMHTPADVHYGHADTIDRDRDTALDAARRAHPERFGTRTQARPKILDRDPATWINKPETDELQLAA